VRSSAPPDEADRHWQDLTTLSSSSVVFVVVFPRTCCLAPAFLSSTSVFVLSSSRTSRARRLPRWQLLSCCLVAAVVNFAFFLSPSSISNSADRAALLTGHRPPPAEERTVACARDKQYRVDRQRREESTMEENGEEALVSTVLSRPCCHCSSSQV
jgi:hypothetical protein